MSETDITLADGAVQICPFATYEAMRKSGPIYRDPVTGFFVVLDHKLIRTIAGQPTRFINQTGIIQGARSEAVTEAYRKYAIAFVDGLVTGDGEQHLFQRSLVEKIFTHAKVADLESYLNDLVDKIIDGVIDRQSVDFHREVAGIVPLTVIADQLGLPRADLPNFKRWSDAQMERSNGQLTEAREIELVAITGELHEYIRERGRYFRRHPTDCLLSDLVHANIDGRKVTEDELVSICTILIVAGNETTTGAMDNALVEIIRTPGLEDRLRNDPLAIARFVEESLRLDALIQGLFRRAVKTASIAGIDIPEGAILDLRWGAANRDPNVFADPETLDPDRVGLRGHMTFGFGAHFCLGSHLARSEIRILFDRLLPRMRNIRLANGPDSIVRAPHYVAFGVSAFDIGFDKIADRTLQ